MQTAHADTIPVGHDRSVCPACDGNQVAAVGPYIGTHPIFQRMGLVRCTGCGLTFAHPQPSATELAEYYGRYWDGEVAVSTPSTRRYYMAQSLSRVNYLQRFGIFKTPPAVLDVGAGLGLFHDGLVRLGIEHNYIAVESDRDQLGKLRQRIGESDAYAQLDDVPHTRKFDLLILSHVLEHLAQPHTFVTSLMQRLRPGGLLFVEVPNQDYRYKATFESHLLFFDPQSLRHFLSRHGEVLDVDTVGKEASKFYVAHVHPRKDPLRPLKEIVKTLIAVTTPDFDTRQIERFEMARYGGDRQWLRAVTRHT